MLSIEEHVSRIEYVFRESGKYTEERSEDPSRSAVPHRNAVRQLVSKFVKPDPSQMHHVAVDQLRLRTTSGRNVGRNASQPL
jgi:hypothetical protein